MFPFARSLVVAILLACFSACGGGASPAALGQRGQAVGTPTITSFTPASGAVNTQVTLTGTNLTGVTTVRFNDTASQSVTVVDDTTVKASAPEGVTSGPISVIDPVNGTATSSTSFTATTPATPTVTDFSPQYGPAGTSVTLNGSNLTSATARFGSISATVGSGSDSQVVLTVPAGAVTGPITVTTAGGSINVGPFTVVQTAPPVLATFTPDAGTENTFVIVSGSNLAGVSEVTFNGLPASNFNPSASQISVYVPIGATTGPIAVSNEAGSSVSSTNFAVPAQATVSSFAPTAGTSGTTVSISGTNFTSVTGVRFNGKPAASFTVIGPTQIDAVVPAAATSGPLTVVRSAGNATSQARFSILSSAPPTITSFTPSSGSPGGSVNVTGTNFTGTRQVSLNGVSASFSVNSDTALSFSIPNGATTGPFTIDNTAGSATSGTDLTVSQPPPPPAPPVIAGFSPTDARAGSLVTVTGSGFTGVSYVALGNLSVSFTVVDDSTITFTVPLGASNGRVAVNRSGAYVQSSGTFTVDADAAPVIHSITTKGNPSIVYGAYFTGTTRVQFNGVDASSFSLQSDGKLYAYRPYGAFGTGKISVTNSLGTATSTQDYVVQPPMTAVSFSPSSGPPGSTVTVTGTNLSRVTSVYFGRNATFRVLSDTQLEVTVPRGVGGPVSLQIQSSTEYAFLSGFTVTGAAAPSIARVVPDSALPGTAVDLYGTNFSGASEVDFNGLAASSFTVQSDGRITVNVPSGATSGPVVVNNGAGTASIPFTVIASPAVTGFTPTSGTAGTQVTLTGTGFSYVQSVSFANGRSASFYALGDTQLVATVPLGAVDGPITLSTGSSQIASAPFSVLGSCVPTVTGFTPTTGGPNTYVTVTGTCFTGTGSVSFNGANSTYVSVGSDTSLTARVAPGATTGPIGVTNSAGTGTSSASFDVIPPPTIDSISPTSGTAGTVVTLTGTHLASASTIYLAGSHYVGTFTVVSDTELAATIPDGAGSGPFTVNTSGGQAVSSQSFTVLSAGLPTVTGFSPGSGGLYSLISVQGTHFTGATEVRFGGVSSTSFSVSSDTVLSAYVPSGARTGPITVVNTVGSADSAASFTVLPPPSITWVSPGHGTAGTTIQLAGLHLAGTTSVQFSSTPASFTVVDDEHLTLTVPNGAGTGRISVGTPGGYGYTPDDFLVESVAPPTLSSFSPTSAAPGYSVILSGSHFTGATEVRFNGQSTGSFTTLSDSSLRVYVPYGATTGRITLSNTVGSAVSATDFVVPTLHPPQLSGFSPASGTPGTQVTITGSGLTGVSYVTFHNRSATVTAVSDSQLTATVPMGATTGTLQVSNSQGSSTSLGSFTVTSTAAPTVGSFSPSSGGSGTSVHLYGSGFSGLTAVRFNGVSVESFSVVSDGELYVSVPPGASTGAITVVNTVGSADSASSFTVAGSASISGFSPTHGPAGTVVTITGSGLTGVTGVRLHNTSVSLDVATDTQGSFVVPGGATSGPIGLVGELGLLYTSNDFTVDASGPPAVTGLSPAHGGVGTRVLVSGSGFTGVTGVRFGATSTFSYEVDADDLLVATVPAGASSGTITVTNGAGSGSSAASFTIDPVPAIASFTPTSGGAGTSVTITGSGFTGATAVTFTGGPAASFTVDSNTQITAIAPGGVVSGPITVQALGGDRQTSSWFSVLSGAAPTITGFGPGKAGVGATITITGTHFAGVTEVRIDGHLVDSFEVLADGVLSAVVPASATSGYLTVTNDTETALSASPLIIVPPPTVTGLSPTTGPVGTQVTLTGSGFSEVTGVSMQNGFSSTTAHFAVVDDAHLTVVVPSGSLSGGFRVSNPGGSATSAAFTIQAAAAPVVLDFAPDHGGPGTLVVVRGTGFNGATDVSFNGVSSPLVELLSGLGAYAVVPPGATTGKISVTNSAGTGTSTADFVVGASNQTSITSVVPASAPRGATVTINGANFTPLQQVGFTGSGASEAQVLAVSPTQLQVVVPEGASSGLLVVYGPSGPAVVSFTVLEPPQVASASPGSVQINTAGTAVVLTGKHFAAGATVTFGGVAATSVTVDSATQITAVAPSRATPGAVDVVVTNSDGQSGRLREGFTYTGTTPAPTVTSVTPASGPSAGGASVTITGSGFVAGATVTFSGVAATSVTVVNATTITCTTPAVAGGASTVTVTNVDTQAGSKPGAYTFVPGPHLATISPSSGPTTGGTALTLSGTGFRAGLTLMIGGQAAVGLTVVSSTQLTATTPAHATAAPVDVIVQNDDGQSDTAIGGFTYASSPAPTVGSVNPTHGPATGGNTVAVIGTGFAPGATVKLGGVAASPVTFVNATQLNVVAPAHAVGLGNVDVTNADGQSASLSNGYTFDTAPAPTIATPLSPAHGSTLGGTRVTITGTHFVSGLTVLFGGTAGTIIGTPSSTSIVVDTPAHAGIGAVDVVVTNPDAQSATAVSAFTYDWGAAPTVSSVGPGHGPVAGGTAIVITGTGFVTGATVTVGGVAATGVTVASATEVDAVTAAHSAGTVAVVVTNTDGQAGTLASGFVYDAAPVLTVSSVSPSHGPSAGGTTVTITGDQFVSGATVTFGSVDASSVTFISQTQLTAVAPAQAAGTVAVTVTNPGGAAASLASAYTYDPAPAPTVSTVTPSTGPTTGGTTVTINGASFVSGATVLIGGVAATNVVFGSASSLTAQTPAHAAGAVDVVVHNPDGQDGTATAAFTYLAQPAPTLTSLSPTSGDTNGGTSVALTGTGFVSGTTVSFGGTPATSVSFGSGTSLTAVTPAGASGAADVTVHNPDGQQATLAAAFTYVDSSQPTIESLTASSGSSNGGDSVTLHGAGFATGATVTFGGSAATQVVVASATSISLRTPAHAAGSVTVTVRNPDGKQASLASGFTYLAAPAPTLTAVSPATGKPEGGDSVTLTGTGFASPATVKFGDVTATGVQVDSATSLTAVTAAMPEGTVSVTVVNPDGQSVTLASAFTVKGGEQGCGCGAGGGGFDALALVVLEVLRRRRRRQG